MVLPLYGSNVQGGIYFTLEAECNEYVVYGVYTVAVGEI